MFVVPNVHFGPFGNLGGSEFSYLLSEEGKKKFRAHTFVFHGTVTHDLNPTSSSELDKITGAIERILKRSKYSNHNVALSTAKSDECIAESLIFGDSSFTGVTRAPLVTEDINFGLGLSMSLEAEKHVKNSIIADQHNAETGELTSFEPGSEIGYKYIMAVKDSVSKKLKQEKLKIGISEKHPASESLGQAGIKIAVLSTFPNYVLVLLDSNGVTPGFRNRIKKEVMKLGNYKVGVYTTDTHQTNAIRGVLNPVKEDPILMKAILEGVKEAVDDMQDASTFVDKEWFEIRAIGARHATELVSTVNSIVAVAKITAPLILIGAILVILAILSRL
jgi:putative membrane protein